MIHSSAEPGAQPLSDQPLSELVYRQLKAIAHARMLGERNGHLLHTTALVHEALVKLTQVATVEPHAGLYCLGGYVVLMAAALGAFEPHELWERAEELGMALPAADAQARA